MSKQEDILATSMIVKEPFGDFASGRPIVVYFAAPNDSMILKDYFTQQADQSDFGVDRLKDTSPVQNKILKQFDMYVELGIIKSYQVSTSYNSNIDVVIGVSSFSQAKLIKGTLGGTISPNLEPSDSLRESAILFDDSLLNNSDVDLSNMLIFHEIAHALGLKDLLTVGLTGRYDSYKYSAMSYNPHSDLSGTDAPTSLMLLDYLAFQEKGLLYNKAYEAGDNTYQWSKDDSVLHTIYDTAGKDAISADGHERDTIIDLREGHFSSYGKSDKGSEVPVENLAIAYGTVIENAIGGSGSDVLIGNDTGNELKGGKGSDILTGGGSDLTTKDWQFFSTNKIYLPQVDGAAGSASDNDTLLGGEGNDYLYGMTGNDKLEGGIDNDFLYGGAGDDELTGGEGADALYGGAGTDTYIFTGSFGRDSIRDSDGRGSIVIDGFTLSNLKQTAVDSIVYRDAANKFEVLKINNGSSTSLIITSLADKNNTITINNWAEGQLGLVLTEKQSQPANGKILIAGDNDANALYANFASPYESTVYVPPVEINAGGGNDYLYGSFGADILNGGEGNDWINAGHTYYHSPLIPPAATDPTREQHGGDVIEGGEGNDVITGPSFDAVWHGGNGRDVLLANTTLSYHMGEPNLWRDDSFSINYLPESNDRGVAGLKSFDNKWQDLQSYLEADFKVYKESKGGADVYSYSMWAGIKPGVHSGNSALGNGWSYEFTFDKAQALPPVDTTGKGILNYYYYTLDYSGWDAGISGKEFIKVMYKNPNFKNPDGTTVPVDRSWDTLLNMHANPVSGEALKESFADTLSAQLFGDDGEDLLVGWLGKDELHGGKDNDYLEGGAGNDILDGGLDKDVLGGGAGNDTLIGGDGDDILVGDDAASGSGDQNDVLFGGDGNDVLNGTGGDDYLVGGEGRDTLFGGDGNDTLVGGIEDDSFTGGSGNNLFIISDIALTQNQVNSVAASAGSNQTLGFSASNVSALNTSTSTSNMLLINAGEGNDTLALVGVSSFEQIGLGAFGENLTLSLGNSSLVIKNGLNGAVEQIALGADADQFNGVSDVAGATQLHEIILNQLAVNVTATAKVADKLLVGGLLDDVLTAHVDGSTLMGGKGNDAYHGDIGDDIYVLRAGDDQDSISEKGGSNKIKLTGGITPQQVILRRRDGDLIVDVASGESITVHGMFDVDSGAVVNTNAIHHIEFDNGDIWDAARIQQESGASVNLVGTSANNLLAGYDSDDVLSGHGGDDILRGGRGNDIYHFASGDGVDRIDDTGGHDSIHFSNGITESQVVLRADTNNNLVIRINNQDSITVVNALDSSGQFNAKSIEEIHFGTTGIWNAQRIQAELARNQSYLFNGTTIDEVLVGDNANQVFIGNKGDDQLTGGAAADTYKYSMGDGHDVIQDINGVDRLELTGIKKSDVTVSRIGDDVKLTVSDGGSITVKNIFTVKPENQVSPTITSIIEQLQNRWIFQAEELIEEHYGLTGSGDIEIGFSTNSFDERLAWVEMNPTDDGLQVKLMIDLSDFSNPPNGSSPLYYDRVIAHEMVHAIMARATPMAEMPGWFLEGTAEFIHGADSRVNGIKPLLNSAAAFNAYFKTTEGSPESSAGYAVSYIAVKLLDNEIRDAGGLGIRDVFDHLQQGATLDQALQLISEEYSSLSSRWINLDTFEAHFESVGYEQFRTLLTLGDLDTGSIAGSDYGNPVRTAETILPDAASGNPKNINLIVPDEYLNSGAINGAIETLVFDDGQWTFDQLRMKLLEATDGDDTVQGTNGADTLIGAKGNDVLYGKAGDDTYIYSLGDGQDTIHEESGIDVLAFGEGINPGDIQVRHNSQNLEITINNSGKVIVEGVFNRLTGGTYLNKAIEQFTFYNGDIWSWEKIKQEALKPSGNSDWMFGFETNDLMSGEAGDDFLFAEEGNDTLSGGLGNDVMNGDGGDDVYHYRLGDGHDEIYDMLGGYDVIKFDGVTENDVALSIKNERDLVIEIRSGGAITLSQAVSPITGELEPGYSIEEIHFANNIVWDVDDIAQKLKLVPLIGTDQPDELYGHDTADFIDGKAGNDTLIGRSGNDTLIGGVGDDRLDGEGGADVYRLEAGDGKDWIGSDKLDTIEFGQNIDPNDVVVRRRIENYNSSFVFQYTGDDRIHVTTDEGYFPSIKFSDGTEWDFNDAKLLAVTGTESNDTILGGSENDYLDGRAGDDRLEGYHGGNDTFVGGTGDDTLIGNSDDDTYIYRLGDGIDLITDSYGNDVIELKNIASDDVIIRKVNSDLEIKINGQLAVVVEGMFNSYIDALHAKAGPVESIRFDSGEEWNFADIVQHLNDPEIIEAYFSSDGKYIGGWGFPGATVVVEHTTLGYELASGIIQGGSLTSGYFSLELPFALSNEETVSVFAKNADGEISKRITLVAPDLVAPEIPSASFDAAGLVITGVAEAGSTVIVKNAAGTELKTATANASGAYSITLNTALINKETVNITAKDIAGNISAIKSLIAPDKTPPAVPTASFDAAGLVITGNAEAGSTVSVKNAAGTELKAATANASGAYSITLNTALINKETVNITAKDTAGNVSAVKSLIAPDKTPPSVPTASFDSAGLVITGTAEAGSTVSVKNAAGTELKTATANASGAYSITLNTALINKETVNITAKDAAGNVSPIQSIIAPDKTAPAIPSASIDATRKIITGVAEAGSVVEVRNTSNVVLGSITANATNGSYTINLPTALAASQTVNVTAKDAAGNVSAARQVVAGGVIDTTPPPQPTASFDATGKIISGTAEAGSTVIVKNAAGTELKTVTANITTGAYSITLDTALINKETVNVTAKDAAGNVSPIQSIIAPDKTAPAIPSASIDATRKIITGVAEAGSVVEVRNTSNVVLGSITANATNGSYTINLPTALAASQTVNITAKDAAGNISTAFTAVAPGATPNPSSITIQAENYTSMSGVWNETTTDVGGGQDTGNINTGDWMAYNNVAFNVPATGVYKVTYRVASLNGGGRLALRELSNESVLNSVAIPKTSGWQTWVDVTQEITLSGGTHNFKIYAESGGFNVNWFKLEPVAAVVDTTPPPQPSASFDATGKIISGIAEAGSTVSVKNAAGTELKTITANITTGAYSITLDTALINKETVNVTAKDAAGNISAIQSIIAPDKTPPAIPSASIDSTRKVITGVAEAGSLVEVRNTSNIVLGSITANATNGSYTINLPTALAASQTVNIAATDAAGNISAVFTTVAPGATPNPSSITIQAENYTSMSGVWNEPTTDVGGGQDTGNINTGDWMAYNNVAFNVPATGVYKVTYRVASLNGGGRLALRELSDESVLNSVAIPKTSGWQTWVDVTQEITLSSGTHNFKIYAESGGFNVNWFKLEPVAAATSLAQSAAVFAAANFDLGHMIANYEAEFENSNSESGTDEAATLPRQLENLRSGGTNIGLLIQAMASFEPIDGTGLRNRNASMDHNQLTLAVES